MISDMLPLSKHLCKVNFWYDNNNKIKKGNAPEIPSPPLGSTNYSPRMLEDKETKKSPTQHQTDEQGVHEIPKQYYLKTTPCCSLPLEIRGYLKQVFLNFPFSPL